MAAAPSGGLGPAFGLRLLLAAVLQAVSGGGLRGSPLASGRGCAEEDGSWGHFGESHLKREEGLGVLSRRCGRRATWLFPPVTLILPGSGFLTVLAPGFRLS